MTDTEQKSGIINFMEVMNFLGRALQGDGFAIVPILSGDMDVQIVEALQYKQKMDSEQGRERQADYSAEEHLKRIKEYLRAIVQKAFSAVKAEQSYAEREAARFRKEQDHRALVKQLQESNKPHPMGTVDELAKKLGVSKSEIRRRKADNTLNELLLQSTENA